jgi:carboxymethylenebutenolidase
VTASRFGPPTGVCRRTCSGSGPGILLLQEIFGVSDYITSRAQDLADLGYVALAPEIYWRIGASRVENGPDALDPAFGMAQQVDWEGR